MVIITMKCTCEQMMNDNNILQVQFYFSVKLIQFLRQGYQSVQMCQVHPTGTQLLPSTSSQLSPTTSSQLPPSHYYIALLPLTYVEGVYLLDFMVQKSTVVGGSLLLIEVAELQKCEQQHFVWSAIGYYQLVADFQPIAER